MRSAWGAFQGHDHGHRRGQAYEYMIIGQQSSEDNILIGFQLNTVVNSHNWMEDMAFEVNQLRPVRWKVIFLKILKSDQISFNV